MNIHEHQAKEVLYHYGIPVPQGFVAFSTQEAVSAAQKLQSAGHSIFVVKAQIHAGGRGKAGGVKVVKTIADVEAMSAKILGSTLVTPQTGPEGKVVRRLYIEAGSSIVKEYYLCAVLDRQSASVVFVASTEGGMEIEEVAHSNPEKICKVSVDQVAGVQPFHVRKIAFALGFAADKQKFSQISSLMYNLYNCLLKTDAIQLEINPLVETADGNIVALDGKMNFDDNALFRQQKILEMRDLTEEEELETKATNFGLSYVKMEGNIGCMVNGAGLAMATMDIIKLHGAAPANFLDVGGGANKEKVTEAFKIILSDKNVEAILVNIFGGIMKCDIIAEGILAAAKEVNLSVPLVVRLEGTNVELGKQIISNSGLKVIAANDLDDAAQKVVATLKR